MLTLEGDGSEAQLPDAVPAGRPGTVVVCDDCGARSDPARAHGTEYREGGSLLVTWRNGPYPRHSTPLGPQRCLWCCERRRSFPSLMARPLPSEAPWFAGGPKVTYEIPVVGRGGAVEGVNEATPEPVVAEGRAEPPCYGDHVELVEPAA